MVNIFVKSENGNTKIVFDLFHNKYEYIQYVNYTQKLFCNSKLIIQNECQ